MADLTLRPLSLGELLDRAFSIFRHRAGALIVPLALGMAPAILLLVASFGEFLRFSELAQERPGDPAAMEQTLAFMGRFFGIAIVGLLGFVFGRGAVLCLALGEGRGRSIGVGEAMRGSLSRYLGQLGLAVLEAALLLVVTFGVVLPFSLATGVAGATGGAILTSFIMLVVVFGAWLGVSAALFVSTAALLAEEGVGPFAALDRSWKLTRGSRGRILALMLIVWVLSLMLFFAMAVIFGMTGTLGATEPSGAAALASMGLNLLVNLFVGAFYYVAQAVMYIDLRVRREGFDLEMLATEGGVAR